MSESSIVARLNQVPQWNSFKPVADTAASVINDLETELSAKTRELAEAKAEAELLREDAERYRRLFQWAANELLSCDYGENDGVELVGKPQIGWRVHGWRFKENNFKIYGESIEIAVQNQIEDAAPSARG